MVTSIRQGDLIIRRTESWGPLQDGRAHGQTGAGVGVGGSAGVRERKKVAESTRKYTTTGSTKGPVALHDGKLDVRIRLMRDGRTIAAVTSPSSCAFAASSGKVRGARPGAVSLPSEKLTSSNRTSPRPAFTPLEAARADHSACAAGKRPKRRTMLAASAAASV